MTEEGRTFQLKYVGERFFGARFPLDVIPDLPAFRDLLASYAKALWRAEHQQRQRLPKGFDRSLSFDLVGIEKGSAMPRLDWSRSNAQKTLPGLTDELDLLVNRSFEELTAVIDGVANDHYPKVLSPEQIAALNKFGAGLREHERIEFVGSKGSDGNVVYLDAGRRKALLTRVRETYDARYEAIGRLTGLHEVGRLTIDTDQYGEIQVQVDPERIPDFDGNLGAEIQFSLRVTLDSNDAFRGVVEVYDIDLIDEDTAEELDRCRKRLAELQRLPKGWHNGEGESVCAPAAAAANSFFSKRPAFAKAYRIFPMLSGGLLIEFVANGWDFSVEITHSGAPEIYGVEIEGGGEIDAVSFGALDDNFFKFFDEKTGYSNG